VALSKVPETPDKWQNKVLMLPTDALSVLKVRHTRGEHIRLPHVVVLRV
jgi:hypothetical protein